MKNAFKMLWLLTLSIGVTACSDLTNSDESGINSDVLAFKISVDNNKPIVNTKAPSYSYYPDGTTLIIGINSNVEAINQLIEDRRTSTLTIHGNDDGQIITSDPILYWNDMGGRDADLDIWGVYLAGQNVDVSNKGLLSWEVATNQSEGIAPNDLQWSDNIRNIKYKETANMVFTHVLCKITMNLTVGEGFSTAEAATTKVVYTGNLTKIQGDASKTEIIEPKDVADITPAIKANFEGGMKASYEAIVVPTRQLTIGDQIATVKIGNNTYYVKSKENRTFESGKNYIYNVSVKKSGVTFVTSTVVDWENVNGDAEAKIIFSAGEGNSGSNGIGPNSLNNITTRFAIFTSHDNVSYDADTYEIGTQAATEAVWVPAQGIEGTSEYVAGYWSTPTPIYWDSDADDTYFRGFSPMDGITSDGSGNFSLEAGQKDYVWGTSGNDVIKPNTGSVSMAFQHIMSKIVLNVITTDGSDAVDLSSISQQTVDNIVTTAKFNIGTGTYAPYASESYGDITLNLVEKPGSNQKKYVCEFNIFPQTLVDEAQISITIGNAPDSNTYHQRLNTILASGVPVDQWIAGKRYIYTILLRKTEQKFTATLVDWEDVYTEENEAEL